MYEQLAFRPWSVWKRNKSGKWLCKKHEKSQDSCNMFIQGIFYIFCIRLKKCIKMNFSKKALNTAIKIIKKNWKTTIKKLERDNKNIIEETIGSESTWILQKKSWNRQSKWKDLNAVIQMIKYTCMWQIISKKR